MSDPTTPKRVLIVDDNDGDVRLLTEAIMESGVPIRVVAAKSALEAITLLGVDPHFDLILSDLNMPRMSGVELFMRLQQSPVFRAIPMAIMSSSRREKLPVRVSETVAVPYFVKADSWAGFVRLAKELHGTLTDGGAHDPGHRLADRMTPPTGFARFREPGPTAPG